jgi:hypothetical protein
MTRLITRASQGFLLVLVLAAGATAQYNQDLYINNVEYDPTGQPIVSGSPTLTATSTNQLQTGPLDPTQIYLVLYDASDNQVGTACKLYANWAVHVLSSPNGFTATINQTATAVTVNGTSITFAATTAEAGYSAFSVLSGGSPVSSDSTFTVTDGNNTAQCAGSFGPMPGPTFTYANGRLRITTEPVVTISTPGNTTLPVEPPIPIIGGSLKFYAPKGRAFFCPDPQSCHIDGVTAQLLQVTHSKMPRIERYLNLAGISSWRITGYPQQLEIKPSFFGSTLNFTLPSSSMLTFKRDLNSNGDIVAIHVVYSVGNTSERPQQFVVDWSPGWLGWLKSRRNLSVPCVQCTLNLVVQLQ